MDDLFDDAWKEAEATFPPGKTPWITLEFRHEDLNPPLRIVSDNNPEGKEFRLEADAPVDGGNLVHFDACPFEVELRINDPQELPKLVLIIDNVARPLEEVIRTAVKQRNPVVVRFRAYLGDDKDEVHAGPIELNVYTVTSSGNRLTCTATTPSWQKEMFPSLIFDRIIFDELVEQAAL